MRLFVARHGETVFNAAGRMQGDTLHTPLTRAGFAQAEAMGRALRATLGPKPALELWASPAGRALQTLAIVAEHLELDWHAAHIDGRLAEMAVGEWSGRNYREIAAESPFTDEGRTRFTRRPPGGEWYDEVAARLGGWIDEFGRGPGDRLAVMHGMSSRVLRGLLTALPHRADCGAPLADPLPQGAVAVIEEGRERVLAAPQG